MTDMQRFDFGGKPLSAIAYKGRAVFIARQIGALLDYANDGGRLVDKITADWSNELLEGQDVIKIEGDELADFKALEPTTGAVGGRASSIVLLTQSGVDLVCVKTHKAIGVRLRRFLVDEVLPALRSGEGIPARGATPAPAPLPPEDPRLVRERRLSERQRLDEARFKTQLVAQAATIAERQGRDPAMVDAWRLKNLGRAGGMDVTQLLPAIIEPAEESAESIAIRLGVHPSTLGRCVISSIPELVERKNVAGLCRVVQNVAPGTNRAIPQCLYTPAAVALIEARHAGWVEANAAEERAKADRRAERDRRRKEREQAQGERKARRSPPGGEPGPEPAP